MAITLTDISFNEGLNSDSMMFKATADGTTAAAAVYVGFTPRYIKVWNISDGVTDEWFTNYTANTSYRVGATGLVTVGGTNGITLLTSVSATVVKATNSPLSDGPGFAMGIGILSAATKVYQVLVQR